MVDRSLQNILFANRIWVFLNRLSKHKETPAADTQTAWNETSRRVFLFKFSRGCSVDDQQEPTKHVPGSNMILIRYGHPCLFLSCLRLFGLFVLFFLPYLFASLPTGQLICSSPLLHLVPHVCCDAICYTPFSILFHFFTLLFWTTIATPLSE